MNERIFNVLFLCTGNSARSILAESLLNQLGQGRFRAFSAGSHPAGQVNPFARELIAAKGLPTDHLRSKSWDEFTTADAPPIDFIFTVCDNAAGEICPIWPGNPMTAHWGLPDPAAVTGSDEEKRKAFVQTWLQLTRRITPFVALPLATLDRLALQRELNRIGEQSREAQ